MTPSAELEVTTHFSLLRGASSAEELFATAALQGWRALGVTDRNTVAGLVRAHLAAKATGVRLLPGCRLDLSREDGRAGASLLVFPRDRAGWSRLCRLLTLGKRRAGKGRCRIGWADVAAHAGGWSAVLLDRRLEPEDTEAFADLFADGRLALTLRRQPGEAARLDRLRRLARRLGRPLVATGDVLYHAPQRRALADVLAAIRRKTTVEALGPARVRLADRHLLPPAEVARRLAAFPEALAEVDRLVDELGFSLDDLAYQYPEERPDPTLSPQEELERRVREGARARYPAGIPPEVEAQLAHELALVARLGYAPYFLTVHSIVRFARSRGILCQGRGSAANSAICYVLGITAIDPVRSELLFERFVSEERGEPPDIDVDFEHERREEVIQWIYDHYGRDRAALAAVVIRYRARGAIREVGKALGLPEDMTAALSGQVWGWSTEGVGERHARDLGLDPAEPRLKLALELARELIGTPRHLSQHPGGFVLTETPLLDLVPIEPAAMDGRQVIEWEKDDLEALKFMKVDVLGLGMLGCLRRAFDLLRAHKGLDLELATIPPEDPATYAMIQRADTLGVFQIESRAQMAMLPRLKPRTFYDLVIEVAIVRPGPIQGEMVHPYLRRREGKEPVTFPSPELERVLGRTLGVPLFQEQAMKLAIVCAGFTPAEADALRRSMATFKFTGGVAHFRDKLVAGMVARGYDREFAERTFRQIEGFGSYGFPESHAASFALLAYASSWLKCHHPEVFACALLNAQPMGFYAPAQIVRDAQAHGVEVRPVCIAASDWDSTLEPAGDGRLALRLGMRMVAGLAEADARAILRHRGDVRDMAELHRRSGATRAAFQRLAEADAFRAWGLNRRAALWAARGLVAEAPLPLFAAVPAEGPEPAVALRPMTQGAEVVEDYRAVSLTLREHPVAFLRAELDRRGFQPLARLAQARDGQRFRAAGIVLVRQKPGSAKGVMFITLEDEGGIGNLVVWPRLLEANRRLILSASMLGVEGTVQRQGEVVHLVARRLHDLSALLASVGGRDLRLVAARGDEARGGGGPDARDAPRLAFRSQGIGHPRAIRVERTDVRR
ncbi:MAG: error-prone DNA polymerase [Thermaurantiacus sp.]|uniref:error-prone DNA polymerase n=1 Tax=Thermaurantiacus sp. TaxID=2820283 RepID=UPI00298EE95A|nr:error-prone DNA polymerase [Thermaurantiacus sp.]MDW8414580.1 error-prone DNA polymerase [Thermaurantiacus sp.]